jgi:glutathione S-transferase
MLRLYYFPGTCAFAPHMLLEEIGEPFELEMVVPVSTPTGSPDLASSAQWRAVNPKGRVPALLGVAGSSGGATDLLTEVSAILFYLGRSYPDRRLLPDGAAEQARCIEWCNYLATSLHAVALAQISRGARFSDDPAQHPAIASKGLANAREGFAYVESVLADGRPWALPAGLSVADFYVYLLFTAGERVVPDMADRHPCWARLADKMRARASVERATVREQEALADARQGRFHGRRLIEPPRVAAS